MAPSQVWVVSCMNIPLGVYRKWDEAYGFMVRSCSSVPIQLTKPNTEHFRFQTERGEFCIQRVLTHWNAIPEPSMN